MLEPGREKAIQVLPGAWRWLGQGYAVSRPCGTQAGHAGLSLGLGLSLPCCASLQKMDRNKDGVVTIEEFLESCQKVKPPAALLRGWATSLSLGNLCPPIVLLAESGQRQGSQGQGWASALGTVLVQAFLCR